MQQLSRPDGTGRPEPAARRRLRLAAYTDAEEIGGAEQSLGNLLEALGPHVDVAVFGVEAGVVETVAGRRPGTRTRLLPRVRGKSDVGAIAAHVYAVVRERPDILHVNLRQLPSCQYGLLAGLLARGVRVVAVQQSPIPVASVAQRLGMRALAARLAAHVAVGERSARMTEEALRLPASSVQTIYNGVPDTNVEPLTRTRGTPVVGAVGRLSREKGFDLLLRALPSLPGVSAIFVGDGPERLALERLAAELGVSDRIEMTGWTQQSRRYLGSFDLLVVPSRFEGFPLVVLEAMLAQLPVVAADVGSVAEAVVPEETGLLVPPEDANALAEGVRRLLAQPELRRSMGESARARALERFTAERMAAEFERLYDELL